MRLDRCKLGVNGWELLCGVDSWELLCGVDSWELLRDVNGYGFGGKLCRGLDELGD